MDDRLEKTIADLSGELKLLLYTQFLIALYSGLTILTVDDADFFAVGKTLTLPLVDITIEILYFFWLCPVLLAAVFFYLHLNIVLLRDIVDDLPDDVLKPVLIGKASYWLIEIGNLGSGRRRRRRLLLARRFTSYLVVSAIVPLVSAIFFFRSLTAHEPGLSFFILAILAGTLIGGVLVWAFPRFQFFDTSSASIVGSTEQGRVHLLVATLIVCAGAVSLYTWTRSAGSPLKAENGRSICDWGTRQFGLAPIDIREAAIAQKPADWLPRFIWVEDFQGLFLSRRRSVESLLTNEELRRFENEWFERREAYLSQIARPDLIEVDLRGANASDVFMAKVDLSRSDLTCTFLERAHLEAMVGYGSVFDRAVLNSAHMEQSQMDGASFRDAHLERALLDEAYLPNTVFAAANLYGARLNAAYLRNADLTDAVLEEVSFQGAFLRDADLRRSNVRGADFNGAIIWGADLSDVRGLTQGQIDGAIGDDRTRLPAGLTVRRCWTKSLPELPRLIRRQWWFDDADIVRSTLCPRAPSPVRPSAD